MLKEYLWEKDGKGAKKISALFTEKVLLAQRGKDQDHLRTVGGISCSAKSIADRVFAHLVKHLITRSKLQTAFIPTIENWQ